MNEVGLVVIGRNEGERLARCLASIIQPASVVYVDSGSTDDSMMIAKAAGARTVELDLSAPFSAARARNAGRAAYIDAPAFIQFVDGDCELQDGWLATASELLASDDSLGAVIGQGRERYPRSNIYNWLCDVEWHRPPGASKYFGGIVMVRTAAFDAAAGFQDRMIAGEEPDLAIRMRQSGWRIQCLAQNMMVHDADIRRFSQWWRRAIRSGHAYADLAHRHAGSPLSDYSRRLYSALFWGAGAPLAATIALIARSPMLALIFLLLPLVQVARLARRERRRPLRDAWTLSLFLMLAKPAQVIGAGQFWLARLVRQSSHLIEYKSVK